MSPHFLGRAELGLEIVWMIDCACRMETPSKFQKYGVQRPSRLVNPPVCWKGSTPQLHRKRSSCASDPSRLCLVYFSVWLVICILYHKLYHTVHWHTGTSVFLSSVWCSSKWLNLSSGSKPMICSQIRQKLWGTQGLSAYDWYLKWKVVLWDWALNLWGLHELQAVSARIAWCKKPVYIWCKNRCECGSAVNI